MTQRLETYGGEFIGNVCKKACALATEKGEDVKFTFNAVEVIAHPDDNPDALYKKWEADFESAAKAWRESPEYKARDEKIAAEEKAKREAHMVCTAQGEMEMRNAEVPWPVTMAQLVEYIESLSNRQHDYGTCVYAMSMAATAAFYFMSNELNVTGFQASCAGLDILRRTRSMKGPFLLIKAEDAMYPQSNPHEKLIEAMKDWRPWLKQEAEKLLAETDGVHPRVREHWEHLASLESPKEANDGNERT